MLLLSTVTLVVFHGLAARMGVVTGQVLIGLVRERYGVKVGDVMLAALVVANIGTTCAEFSCAAAVFELFGISRYISVPAVAVGVSLLVLRGSFHRVERVLLVSTVLKARPDWGAAMRGTLVPRMLMTGEAIAVVTMGTTLLLWGLSFMQSALRGGQEVAYRGPGLERIDVVTGSRRYP